MANDSIAAKLPPYPSTAARKSLSASQLATLNQTIASCLQETLALPPAKRDTPATRTFLSTYAKDAALQKLQSLIWESDNSVSKLELSIRKNALLLAEKLSQSLELQVLLDLAIAYAVTNTTQVRSLFDNAVKNTSSLKSVIQSDLLPAFILLLSPNNTTGLYGLRKAAHCIFCLIHSATPEIVRIFAHSKEFILALANVYDRGLASIAQSYGGSDALRSADSRVLDDWERIWLETKVSLMDTFHISMSSLLSDFAGSSGRIPVSEVEYTFDIVFALLETSDRSAASSDATPFLNQPILADYQHSYDLVRTLTTAQRHAAERDARLDLIESQFRSLEVDGGSSQGQRNPGVLKLLLRSSGVPAGIDNLGKGKSSADKGKGKNKEIYLRSDIASSQVNSYTDPDLDIKVTQVLDIFPDQSPEYIKALLTNPSYPFQGSPEKVIEALLEGTAPPFEELHRMPVSTLNEVEDYLFVKDRQNIFDDEDMDLSKVHVGKKSDESALHRDRALDEDLKADILRRVEALSAEEEEAAVDDEGNDLGRKTFAFDDDPELEGGIHVKILGDGEESGEDEDDSDDEQGESAPPARQSPETILELAYLKDQKLFDRDGATRRSKARADLKVQTGWTDEQIEGWKIMLERNPKKEQILQKHEFSGNQSGPVPQAVSSSRGGRGGGGRSRGGSSRGRGRGGGGNDTARERAWKDKKKATHANHNRKSGHDKKMARGGGPSA